MGELLPEAWGSLRDDDKKSARRPRQVTDVLIWVKCFATYVRVLASAHPTLIPEFMGYMGTIVRASQDFAGLAWVRYDTSFRRQAAQTGHRRWSQLNPTLYSICFTGNAQKVARCELCLGFTHTAAECALRGEADPEMPGRVKAVESAILALAAGVPKSTLPRTSFGLPSGQLCRKYNKEGCTFPACRHTHACVLCSGKHPASACPTGGTNVPSQAGRFPSAGATLRARATQKPY